MTRLNLSEHATGKLIADIAEIEELVKHRVNAIYNELSPADQEASYELFRSINGVVRNIRGPLRQHMHELTRPPLQPPPGPVNRNVNRNIEMSWPTEIADTVSAFEDTEDERFDNTDQDPRETGTYDPADLHADNEYTDDQIEAVADTLGAVASGELDLAELSADEMAIISGDLENPHGEIPAHLQPFAQQVIRHGRRRSDRDADGQ